jgi:hypothetical protein
MSFLKQRALQQGGVVMQNGFVGALKVCALSSTSPSLISPDKSQRRARSTQCQRSASNTKQQSLLLLAYAQIVAP